MSKEFKRWTPKHSVSMQTYEVSCPTCELTYHMEASELKEIFCPLCESEDPIKAKEVKSGRKL